MFINVEKLVTIRVFKDFSETLHISQKLIKHAFHRKNYTLSRCF